jgi:hypothetical protein
MGFLANIYFKVSMHAIAMGVLVGFMFLLALTDIRNPGVYVSATLLIAGLVCTARFIGSDHSKKDIYAGLFFGLIAVFISYMVV